MDIIRYHQVQYGETLGTLSKLYYGTIDGVPVIFNHNRAYIPNPNQIYPGQKLCIPYLSAFERIDDSTDGFNVYGEVDANSNGIDDSAEGIFANGC